MLGFAAGEDGAAMHGGQVVGLAPDGAYLVQLTAVEAGALVEHHVAHGLALHVVVVAVNHELDFVGEGLLGVVGIDELLLDGGEAVFAHVLVGDALLGEVVALLVDGVADTLAELLVVHFVAVLALLGLAGIGGELVEHAALDLDGVVGGLEGAEHDVLGDLFHLAFDHHDVVLGGGDDEVEVSALDVLHRGVDDVLAVEVADAHLGDGAVEGDVADGQGRGSGQGGQLVGHGILVTGDEVNHDLHLGMEVVGEEGTQGAVDQAGDENLVLGGTGLALEETTGETAHGGVFLLVVDGEGHEVDVFAHLFLGADGGEEHGVVHADNGRAVGLFGQLAGFDGDHAAVAEVKPFGNDVFVHFVFYCFLLLYRSCKNRSCSLIKVLIFNLLSPSAGIIRPAKRKCKDTTNS